MYWLAIGLVCLVIASFSLLMYARARAGQHPAQITTDPAVVALRDEVMAQLAVRDSVVLEPRSDDSFHVERQTGGSVFASVAKLYFAVADAPEQRERLVGEYVEGLLLRTRQ